MYIYIGIEDLVGNAIIELVENSYQGEVLFSQIDRYGSTVVQILSEQQMPAMLSISRDRTTTFLRDYSHYFTLFSNGNEEGIRLRENISSDDLWAKFRGYLSIEVMKAFMNERSIRTLGVGG